MLVLNIIRVILIELLGVFYEKALHNAIDDCDWLDKSTAAGGNELSS